jgi:hypothetical protein
MKQLIVRTVSLASLTALCLLGVSGIARAAGAAQDRLQVSTMGYRVPDITLDRGIGNTAASLTLALTMSQVVSPRVLTFAMRRSK